jgi:threonylcarbamoyladenosine tRNA methylthiotransferase MtaB
VDEAGLSYLHVFPFSARKGTPAARMPQLDRRIVKARAMRLRAAGTSALDRRLASLVGSKHAVLIEKDSSGHTPCFAPIRLSASAEPGDIVHARVTGVADRVLQAEPIRQ